MIFRLTTSSSRQINFSLPDGSLLYICGHETMKIGNGSFDGINLHVMAENKQNLNYVKILSQGTFIACRLCA